MRTYRSKHIGEIRTNNPLYDYDGGGLYLDKSQNALVDKSGSVVQYLNPGDDAFWKNGGITVPWTRNDDETGGGSAGREPTLGDKNTTTTGEKGGGGEVDPVAPTPPPKPVPPKKPNYGLLALAAVAALFWDF